MCRCSECGFDLRRAKSGDLRIVDEQSLAFLREISAELELIDLSSCGRYLRIEFTDVLHQLCKLLVSDRPAQRFYHFVLDRIHLVPCDLSKGRFAFECRSIDERHFVIQLALWLMLDLKSRLREAWESGAVRYNYFLKDMESPPQEFAALVAPFNRLRWSKERSRF